MSIRVLARPRGSRLAPVALVRERLARQGVSSSAVSDEALEVYLDGALSAFELEVGRPLLRGTYEEKLAGKGRGRVYLTGTPIDAMSLEILLDDVAVTNFTLDPLTGELYRTGGCWPECARVGEEGRSNIKASYRGGYVPPSLALTWAPSLAVATGQWLRLPTTPDLYLEVTTAGTMAEDEPTWPTEADVEVTSGDAVLLSRETRELPEQLRDLAAYAVMTAYQASTSQAGLASMQADGIQESYFATTAPTAALPEVVCAALANWRGNL